MGRGGGVAEAKQDRAKQNNPGREGEDKKK